MNLLMHPSSVCVRLSAFLFWLCVLGGNYPGAYQRAVRPLFFGPEAVQASTRSESHTRVRCIAILFCSCLPNIGSARRKWEKGADPDATAASYVRVCGRLRIELSQRCERISPAICVSKAVRCGLLYAPAKQKRSGLLQLHSAVVHAADDPKSGQPVDIFRLQGGVFEPVSWTCT